jgi:hypothetical protein
VSTDHRLKLTQIKRFDQLIAYLRDEMGWPIAKDSFDDVDDLFYEFSAEELGIDPKTSAKILEIKRLRPLSPKQPWGIFFVKFEPKKLPVIALRRILGQVALKRRASANNPDRTAWSADDLLFISNYGDGDARQISFAHFSKSESSLDLPTLRVLGWNNLDTGLHLDAVAKELTENLTWPDEGGDLNQWRKSWSNAFKLEHNEVINTAKDLSIRLAELASSIRDRIKVALSIENDSGPLTILMNAFKSSLVNDLDNDSFADMYAQTIAYGLLSARIADPSRKTVDDFTLHMRTSPFLRELMQTFLHIGGRKGKAGGPGIDFDELGVGDVIQLLDNVNIEAVLIDFGDKNRQEDPVMHFFEGFLHAYDKKIRKDRGVFYTPQPVVSYIVRSVHELLQTEFELADGLADITTWGEMLKRNPKMKLPLLTEEPGEKRTISPSEPFVQILDPATGTATFLIEVIDVIHQTLTAKWKQLRFSEAKQSAEWNEYVPKHLLPRLHAFELMMAPYAIAHMKVGLKLAETGYFFATEERARIYLTNALEPYQKQLNLPKLNALAHEASAVNDIKRNRRFTVIIGNPPYSGVSSNIGPWIENLLRSPLSDGSSGYFTFNGSPLDEPNTRWLNDDYVKFLRLAQMEIANSGVGIVGLITNHSWLENPTFRGMRQSTSKTFPKIYLIDLHGNTKKKEIAIDGSKDENVFDIQQGVAISLMVSRNIETSISHSDLYGLRIEKYEELYRSSVRTTQWHSLAPDPALMLWRRFDATNSAEYESFPVITDIFSSGDGDGRGSSWAKGLATTKDHLFISFDKEEAYKKIGLLASTTASDFEVGGTLSLQDTPYFTISDARRVIRKGDWKARICDVTYRPFDNRTLYWHPELYDVGRGASSKRVMSHMFKPNIALVTSRMTKGEIFAHTYITRCPVEVISLSSKTSNNAFVFPLKYYPDLTSQINFEFDQSNFRINLNPKFLSRLAMNLRVKVEKDGLPAGLTPEDILYYTYSLFHSGTYRSRYVEFLKIDFPRLPLTNNFQLFKELARIGEELTNLHLLESPKLVVDQVNSIHENNSQVEKISWADDTVWIDKQQTIGFKGVRADVWSFYIGGYQVCDKWLKDRKGRSLSKDDIVHYQKVIVALSETIRLMKKVDEVINQHGGWPGAFHQAN